MSATASTRTESDDERTEREAREAAEALAARAAEVAGMSDDVLCRQSVTDAELVAEDRRLAALPRPSTRGVTTTFRPLGHERLANAREALPAAVAGAMQAAARGAAKPDGPNLDDLRRAYDLHRLAQADGSFWTALAAVIDGPAPAGMSEAFADVDHAAKRKAAQRAHDVRRNRIAEELEARRIAAMISLRPAMAERIAGMFPRSGKR